MPPGFDSRFQTPHSGLSRFVGLIAAAFARRLRGGRVEALDGAIRIVYLVRIDAAFEPAFDAPLAKSLLPEIAKGLQLFCGEYASDAQLGLRAKAHERSLRFGNVARALFDERLVNVVRIDRLVERTPRLIEPLVE